MKILSNMQFTSPPTLLASWSGMGNAGLIAVDYVRAMLDARPLAEVEMKPFHIPEFVTVRDGISSLPKVPTATLYGHQDHNLLFFECTGAIPGREGLILARILLDMAHQYGVDHIITTAGFRTGAAHTDPSQVFVTSTSESFLELYKMQGIAPLQDCNIGGGNGVLLGLAAQQQITAAALLGTVPSYVAAMPYPKAAYAIVEKLVHLLQIEIDLQPLASDVEFMENELNVITERIQNNPIEPETEKSESKKHNIPRNVMEKITNLFEKAATDHAAAVELKEELDAWQLYDLYEEKFLGLFGNKDRKKS